MQGTLRLCVYEVKLRFVVRFFFLQYLSSPVTKKETYSKELPHLHVGISSQQGWRKTQEDSHVAVDIDNNTMLFGVFDGHGGGEVAKFSSKHIPIELKALSEFRKGDFKESLVGVFHRIDELLRSPEGLEELRTLRQNSQGMLLLRRVQTISFIVYVATVDWINGS